MSERDKEERDDHEPHFAMSQWVLYAIFRARKDHSLGAVAEEIDVPHSTLRKYVIGEKACPVEILKKIYLATRHPLLKELLEPEGYELQPRGHIGACTLPTVADRINEAFAKITDLQRSYAKALSDGVIDAQEYQDLRVMRGNAKDAIEDILEAIAGIVKPGGGLKAV